MKRLLPMTLAALALATAAQAAPRAEAAWSRPAAAGTTGAGFMVLANTAGKPDALVAASTPLAREVQIHRSEMKGGVSSMRRLDQVPLAPGARITFAPGGHHLMFMGLTKALKPGDRVPVTLVFASGARIETAFVVGVAPPGDDHAHH